MSRQAIKYASTTVDPLKSANEIQALVQRYGGTRFEIRWNESKQVAAVRFAIRHPKFGEIPVRLTARVEKIAEILKAARTSRRYISQGERQKKDAEERTQAYRIAWRQLRDFIEQALLAVETGLFPLHEAFMASVETEDPETGDVVTWGELLERRGSGGPHGLRLLAPPLRVIEAEVIEVEQ